MDYKENYKEALDKARNIYFASESKDIVKTLEVIFPELKESEDEKIRKEMINYFKSKYEDPNSLSYDYNKWIAWIEKQDKQHNVWNVEDEHNLKATLGYIEDEYLRRWFKDIVYAKFEKQGEQKPFISDNALREGIAHFGITQWQIDNWLKKYVDVEKRGDHKPTDNVEPKFKAGDWIIKNDDSSVNIDYSCCKITGVENGNYTIVSIYGYKGYNTFETFEKDYHHWTIKDAKDGDVLVNGTILIFVDHLGYFENRQIIYSWYYADSKKFYGMGTSGLDRWEAEGFTPATKKQRDLLFQKMKEAGYEWDTDKKELKKIEQKHAWSEDDDKIIETMCKEGDLKHSEIQWLKSLKDRVQSNH